jgi:ADP-heptose:LPS heptosyltransferase
LKSVGRGAIGIDTRGDIRSVLLLHALGCARVLSLTRYLGSDLRVPKASAELIPFSLQLRRWELNLGFLEPLGLSVKPGSIPPPFFPHLASPKRPARRDIALMPVAPWRGKLWLPPRWQRLAQQLRQKGWEIRVLCGPGQRALALEQADVGAEVVECGSIEQWAAQFARSTLVVTLDSGPMHLADALGLPVIALFGQGWLPLWAPSGRLSRVIAHQDDPDFAVCHPIDANAPLGQKYMNRITVEEVLAAVEETQHALEDDRTRVLPAVEG